MGTMDNRLTVARKVRFLYLLEQTDALGPTTVLTIAQPPSSDVAATERVLCATTCVVFRRTGGVFHGQEAG
jgi:hypothetical protein